MTQALEAQDKTSSWPSKQATVFAVIPLFVAVMAWTRRWMSDDGFIYLRVVQNVLA